MNKQPHYPGAKGSGISSQELRANQELRTRNPEPGTLAPCVVGQYYTIPTLFITESTTKYSNWKHGDWLPVMGPLHEDAEIIGFHFHHYHIDWRFVSARIWNRTRSRRNDSKSGDRIILATVISPEISGVQFAGDPAPRRMRCNREMPDFPSEKAPWFPRLEAAYATRKLPACRTCPHRGLPLANLPPKPDGTVICPGHGLRWRLNTGDLVPA